MDAIDRLYEIYNILIKSGDRVADHKMEYLDIIHAAKGSSNEKRLASQFIPKFLKHFPNLGPKALEAQLDMIQDEDIMVRKLALKHLPGFCKVNAAIYVPKIVDILTQMLMTEDSIELVIVQAALMAIMKIDIQGTLSVIFTQISTPEKETVRKRAIEFLNCKLKVLPSDIFTEKTEKFLLESCKNVFNKVSGEDIFGILQLLSLLKVSKTLSAQNAIVDTIASYLDFEAEFRISAANLNGFMNFLKHAFPFFSPFVSSKKFVAYICIKIFPVLKDIQRLESGNYLMLNIFKILAELSAFLKKDDDDILTICIETIFTEILNYMPLPPINSDDNKITFPKLCFTHIECLLFTFVQLLLKHNDHILTSDDNVDRFQNFKYRLLFLSRVVTHALTVFKDSRQSLMTHSHLYVLIKVFFRIPLELKSGISFSWKAAILHSDVSGKVKRRYEASILCNNFTKREKRSCQELYVPPSKKYKSSLSSSSKGSSSCISCTS